MPIYKYTAFNRKGKEEKGIVDAGNHAQARRILKQKGLYVKALTEDTEKKDRELFPFLAKLLYRVPRRDVGFFARQLGTLLDAGLPLDKSLANIVDQTENEYLKKALIEVRGDVIEGGKLSESMAKHPAIFPPLYHNLVSVGERTGTYEQSLLRLAELEEANQAMKNKVTAALFYPVIMMFFLGGIMIFLLAVVMPQIQQMFVQMNAELPFITRFVLGVSDIFTSFKILIPIVSGIVGFILFRRWKSTVTGRMTWERFLLRVPVFGALIQKVMLARFSRNLGVMLQSRVPLLNALIVVGKIVDNAVFEQEILAAIEKIKEGTRITDAFRDSQIMTMMILGMLSAGEASDRIPEMVSKIADVLEDDVEAAIQKMSSLLEPLMIVLLGLMIIVIMSAILLPMYNLTSQIQV
ncbi:MAG TPA: type II secretion system F family protein [Leptospiraceae bacterium]|nr:type II secretion system F family protein [Leptospirales bacterium]HMW58851.1 type II secretion system F family protein [Leptospiraceae bacterium]HMX57549.1 type II secretion system F family protein [Leptospiraceae bacterium]HMY44485.1 type II secretion system F family protein [Leptospiraceae bacterium]HNE24951.1 type II secretion system F family protein [Leptospiraceae bacterium]